MYGRAGDEVYRRVFDNEKSITYGEVWSLRPTWWALDIMSVELINLWSNEGGQEFIGYKNLAMQLAVLSKDVKSFAQSVWDWGNERQVNGFLVTRSPRLGVVVPYPFQGKWKTPEETGITDYYAHPDAHVMFKSTTMLERLWDDIFGEKVKKSPVTMHIKDHNSPGLY